MSFVKFENVYKRYIMGEITINAADGVSFEIEKGRICCYSRRKRCWKNYYT